MEEVEVQYILSTTAVMGMWRTDFHSVSATMKQDPEHTVMMWGYIAYLV